MPLVQPCVSRTKPAQLAGPAAFMHQCCCHSTDVPYGVFALQWCNARLELHPKTHTHTHRPQILAKATIIYNSHLSAIESDMPSGIIPALHLHKDLVFDLPVNSISSSPRHTQHTSSKLICCVKCELALQKRHSLPSVSNCLQSGQTWHLFSLRQLAKEVQFSQILTPQYSPSTSF